MQRYSGLIFRNVSDITSYLYSTNEDYRYTYLGVENEDGSIVFYRILMNVTCDAQNESYYSTPEGRLYNPNNEPVFDLPYAADAQ